MKEFASEELRQRRLEAAIKLRDSAEEFLASWEGSFEEEDLIFAVAFGKIQTTLMNSTPTKSRLSILFVIIVILEAELRNGVKLLVSETLKNSL